MRWWINYGAEFIGAMTFVVLGARAKWAQAQLQGFRDVLMQQSERLRLQDEEIASLRQRLKSMDGDLAAAQGRLAAAEVSNRAVLSENFELRRNLIAAEQRIEALEIVNGRQLERGQGSAATRSSRGSTI